MVKTVGKKFRRALHFDFHTCPGIKNLYGNFDAEKFADKLSSAHVEYINFTARCNMGFSYYNTEVGVKYDGLGKRDVLKEVIDACHKRGIGVTAYINAGLDHEMGVRHRDWLKVNKDGKIYNDNKIDNFFRTMCYNSGYGEHLIREIKELASYDIDGLFCDCMVVRPCYCPSCVKKMKELGVDINDDSMVSDYQDKVRHEIAGKIKKIAEEKGIKVYFNSVPWNENLHTHGEIECLTTSPAWGYDYFDSVAPYARTFFEDNVYMSGRFQNSWGDFGGIKSLESMRYDMHDAIMNSIGFSVGDHLHPIDGLEDEVWDRVRKVFEEKMLYEPYTENSENVMETGIIVRKEDFNAPPFVQGAVRILQELKIPYNIYNTEMDFSHLKVLIVGFDVSAEENFNKKLKDFVSAGGKVIFSGTGVNVGERTGLIDYVKVCGDDERDNGYFVVPGNNMRWAMYKPCKIIKNISGTEKAKYVDNMFNLKWDGIHTYYYRPQGNLTEYSAAVTDGKTAVICFKMFEAYDENYLSETKLLFENIYNSLLPQRFIEAKEIPASSVIAVTKKDKYKVIHIKTTYPECKHGRGIIEEPNYVKNVKISYEGNYVVKTLPDLEAVNTIIKDGRTIFDTGEIEGYKAFLLVK